MNNDAVGGQRFTVARSSRAEFRERPRPFRRIRNVGSELGVVATGNQPPAPLQREASVVFSLSGIFPSSHFRVKRRKRRRFARRAVVIKRCVHATLRSGARNGTESNGSVQRALLQYKKKQKKRRKRRKTALYSTGASERVFPRSPLAPSSVFSADAARFRGTARRGASRGVAATQSACASQCQCLCLPWYRSGVRVREVQGLGVPKGRSLVARVSPLSMTRARLFRP